MSPLSIGAATISLGIGPGRDGLPTRNSVDLQQWISQTAQSGYQSAPRFQPPPLAPSTMGALLNAQGQG
jgi:hypothetical protein